MSWLVMVYNEATENRRNYGLKQMTENEDLSQLENTNTINPQLKKIQDSVAWVGKGAELEAKRYWKTKGGKETVKF